MSRAIFTQASGLIAFSVLICASGDVHANDLGDTDLAERIAALEQVLEGTASENAVCRDLYERFLGAMMRGEAPPSELVNPKLFAGELADLSESESLEFTALVLEATLGWPAYEMAWARSVGMPYDKLSYSSSETVVYAAHFSCRKRLQPALDAMAELGVDVEAVRNSFKEGN